MLKSNQAFSTFGLVNLPVNIPKKTKNTSMMEDYLNRIQLREGHLASGNAARSNTPYMGLSENRILGAEILRRWHMFDLVLSNLPDLICTFNLNGCFTYANAALLEVWQKPLEAIIGKNTFDLGYPTELAARIQKEVQNVIATQRQVKNLTPFISARGEMRIYEYILSPVLGSDQGIEEVTCTARDVTDRENVAREIASSHQRLHQVLEQAPVAIIVLRGPNLVIEMANRCYRELVQNRELVGRTLADAIPELDQGVLDVLRRVLQTGEPFTASDWRIRYPVHQDAAVEDHWFNAVYHPLREADGSVQRIIAVCSDVTQQVLARRELERANRELEEFAFVSSHDLQEPLRTIGAYTELLHRRYLGNDPQAAEFASFIRRGVARMEELIRDLVAYSRAVHAESTPGETADLNQSLAVALKALEAAIDETRALIKSERLPAVRGETSQFVLVFQNLLSNSLKYRRPDAVPEIEVSAVREGNNWIVSWRDNGIGFEPKYEQRIFGLFKRLHKDEFAGTGLGLAICKRIVERYGGRIWAEGHPGGGSIFRMALGDAQCGQ